MKSTFEFKRCNDVVRKDGIAEAYQFAQRSLTLFRLAAAMRKHTHGKHDPLRARYLQSAALYRQILRNKLLNEQSQSVARPNYMHRSLFGDLRAAAS